MLVPLIVPIDIPFMDVGSSGVLVLVIGKKFSEYWDDTFLTPGP